MNKMRSAALIWRAVMLCLPLSVLAGCSSNSTVSGNNSGNTPALSALGRQPQKPEFCLPTCSANLSKEIDNWQTTLIDPPKPDESAKSSTIR